MTSGGKALRAEVAKDAVVYFRPKQRPPLEVPDDAYVLATEGKDFVPRVLPVIVGAACQAGGIALEDGLSGFLQAFVSNQLQAAIRLSVIGQTGAARLLAKLEPMLVKAAGDADGSTLDDLGSATVMAEIASMNHETLDGRLFRS